MLRGPGGRVERFEHVLAHEVGEVADGLHRHGLVEQLQRLLGFDAEPAAEIPAVLGETVVRRGRRPRAAACCSGAISVPKSEKSAAIDRSRSATTKNRVRLALMPSFSQNTWARVTVDVVARVGEDAEDDRVGGLVAQRAPGARRRWSRCARTCSSPST